MHNATFNFIMLFHTNAVLSIENSNNELNKCMNTHLNYVVVRMSEVYLNTYIFIWFTYNAHACTLFISREEHRKII